MNWEKILHDDLDKAIMMENDMIVYRSNDFSERYAVYHFKKGEMKGLYYYPEKIKSELCNKLKEIGNGKECFRIPYKKKELKIFVAYKDQRVTILLKSYRPDQDLQEEISQVFLSNQNYHEDDQKQINQNV